jgi:hypothetical protein
MVLKQKIENKNLDKESIINGVKILEGLIDELKKDGESKVLEKYKFFNQTTTKDNCTFK